MPPLAMLIAVAAALWLASLYLLRLAYRGRVVPGTVLCRGCSFDLAGLAQTPACPECGRVLTSDDIVPRRVRSPLLIALTLVCVIGMPATSVVWLVARTPAKALNSYKPLWWLKMESLHASSKTSQLALTEIVRRMLANSIAPQSQRELASEAFHLKKTGSPAWNALWGEVLALAREQGQVSDADWTEYARLSLQLQAVARARARQGSPTPLRLSMTQKGTKTRASFAIGYKVEHVTLAGKHVGSDFYSTSGTIGATAWMGMTIAPICDSTPGPAEFGVRCRVDLFDALDGSAPISSWTQDFSVPVTVVAPDASLVEARPGSASFQSVASALSIQPVLRNKAPILFVQCKSAPANLVFDVFVRLRDGDGTLIPAERVSFLAGATENQGINPKLDGWPHAGSFDVILKPSVAGAEANPDFDWLWTGPDIVIENVPMRPR